MNDRQNEVSLWRRAVGLYADVATVFFILLALVVVQLFWFMNDLSESLHPQPWGRSFVPTVTFVVMFAVYETVFLYRNEGRTPGKEFAGVRVVGPDGRPPSLRRSMARTAVVAPLLLVPPAVLGLALVALTGLPALGARRRSLADLVAGTATRRYVAPKRQGRDRDLRAEARPPTVMSILVGRRLAARLQERVDDRSNDRVEEPVGDARR